MRNQRQGVRSTKHPNRTAASPATPACYPTVRSSEIYSSIRTHPVPTAPAIMNLAQKLKTARGTSVSAAKIPLTVDQPQLKQHDISVTIYEPKATIYTNQTGQFPLRLSRRNKYQMLLHGIDSNST